MKAKRVQNGASKANGESFERQPLGDARRLLQDSVQLQALAVQQPPEGDVSQLTDDPERLVQAEEHGELPLPLPRADPDGLGHQAGGDPLQPRDLRPGDHELDWRGRGEEHKQCIVLSYYEELCFHSS